MDNKIKGIIIKSIDAKENDVIVTTYLQDIGCIGLYCKGCKKITSKNAYAIQLFDESEFLLDYNPNNDIQLLKSATLIDEHAGLKTDFERLALASIVIEIVNQINEENMYSLLKNTLKYIEIDDEPYTAFNLFVCNILQILGIEPVVDECAICSNINNIYTISIDDGGFICSKCNNYQLQKLDLQLLKNFRIVNKANWQVYDKIKGLGINDYSLTKLLLDFLIAHSGLRLRSIKAIENIQSNI